MRREDRALHDAWVACDDGHSGLAQPYHHTILPLASARDRRTEIRWGMRDFRLRYGRDATGVWLPETAVDHLTLRLCAEEGVRWTILAPWQAMGPLTSDHPRRVEVGTGHVAVLFYDGPLSSSLSFDSNATTDADAFAGHVVQPRMHRAGPDTIVVAATDGELYGHHQQFRDYFLARLLDHADGFQSVRAGDVMDAAEIHALEPVTLREQSSWSCHHGVSRWTADCPDVRDGHWKGPLRQALDRFAAALDSLSEARFRELGLDLWALRDAWVDVASGFAEPDEWLDERVSSGRKPVVLATDERHSVLQLLRAQASRLQMFASDAWFWGDPRRIETAQALRFAAHAARLADAELGAHLERALVEDLAAVRPPDVPDGAAAEFAHLRSGEQIYVAALTTIEQPPPKTQ